MQKSWIFFFLIFFYLSQKNSLELSNKLSRTNSALTNDDEDNFEHVQNKTRTRQNATLTEVDGDTCLIFSAKQGDPSNCWCPRGYIMCSEEDVRDVQSKLHKIKDLKDRNEVTPPWIKRLCDNSKEVGFKGMSVIIDYELAVLCNDENDKINADFKIIGASGFIPNEQVIEQTQKDPTYVPRKCTVNNFYLCRKVENDNVNCQYSPWSKWGPCIDNKQRRMRKVLRSNQNNDNFCLWNGKKIPRGIIEETRPCKQG
ncbi:secreted protein with altered thrombospondin repeat domain [Plasmodium gonderi]|uniref:Secreted protein with altered thrombospondin repeat domain n=1 Tax=Plasmodium gonderi TaxID=77519 RepID=A0A1Y1JGB4_PLAGO|nr:secreted protein with altered thrombospondin repeat domain [Plasmodium gonderi]GAW79483.1 secreted protein with altered thrombospondin repeat domain [Plasmodium gonderi]